MKAIALNTEAQVFGEIQQNQVAIDASNMNKIVMMLSANLYSDPISSFIREITSNAWDSHIEAKNNEPVLIYMDTDSTDVNQYIITIRDFGTGISPDRFKNVYKVMGVSTKTESNDYHGFFGLGKFSPLAVADMVTVDSYYQGVKYSYLMYKNGLGINIDLVDTSTTEERDGLSVSIIIDSYSKYRQINNAITSQLMFFDNVFYKNNLHASWGDLFNSIKIKHYQTFSLSSMLHEPKILLGKVVYPFEPAKLTDISDKDREIVRSLRDSSLAIRFNIGELDVNPARETLHYSSRTSKAIVDKCKEVIKELHELKFQSLNNGNLKEEDLLTLTEPYILKVSELNFEIVIPEFDKEVSLNNECYSYVSLYDSITNILNTTTSWVDKRLDGERISKENKWYNLKFFLESNSLFNFSAKEYNNIQKKYIRSRFNRAYIRENWGELALSKDFREFFVSLIMKNKREFKPLIKIFYKLLFNKLVNTTKFDISGITQEFINKHKVVRNTTTTTNSYIKLLDLINYDNIYRTFERLKEYSGKYVVFDLDNKIHIKSTIDGYKFVAVAKTNKAKMLKEGIAITFEEFLIINKGKIISDAKLDRMHSDWGYNDLTKLKILNKLTNIPKQEKYILDVENSIKDLKFANFFHCLKDKDKSLINYLNTDKSRANEYNKIFEVMKAFNLDVELGQKFLKEKLIQLGFINRNRLVINN